MKVLVDAHLQPSLCAVLARHGHDATHTLDLPAKNATKDTVLNQISVDEQRAVLLRALRMSAELWPLLLLGPVSGPGLALSAMVNVCTLTLFCAEHTLGSRANG
jgi:hypothetical protein